MSIQSPALTPNPSPAQQPPQQAGANGRGESYVQHNGALPGIDPSRQAMFSGCGEYRYTLTDVWAPDLPRVAFLMLNPSTADAMVNDPTVRRCIGYAQAWGFGGLGVYNLFALRSTDPAGLKQHADPIGPRNDAVLVESLPYYQQVVAAWGTHGAYLGRAAAVEALLRAMDIPLWCLSVTKDGAPGHPLYLSAALRPVRLDEARREAGHGNNGALTPNPSPTNGGEGSPEGARHG